MPDTHDIVEELYAVPETGCDPDLPPRAAAEILRLRAELESNQLLCGVLRAQTIAQEEEGKSLRSELEESKKDAGRYGWLRENSTEYRLTEKDGYGGRELKGWDRLDAAIDAEMAKGV